METPTVKISFTVLGKPPHKERPRHNTETGAVYTPEKTEDNELRVQMAYRAKCGSFMFPKGAYIALRIYAYYGIPKSASKAKRAVW